MGNPSCAYITRECLPRDPEGAGPGHMVTRLNHTDIIVIAVLRGRRIGPGEAGGESVALFQVHCLIVFDHMDIPDGAGGFRMYFQRP